MKFLNIKKSILNKYNIKSEELYLGIALLFNKSLKSTLKSILAKGYACTERDPVTGKYTYLITPGFKDKLASVFAESDLNAKPDTELEDLAIKMKAIFPKGKKEGTNSYWAGGVALIIKRLHLFYKKYGYNYTDAQILKATQDYVNSYKNTGNMYMSTLKYFIFKDSRGASGSVESESQLLTYIENVGEEEEVNNDDWLTNVN